MTRVSLVTTVLNHADACVVLLKSLGDQVRPPDEVIVVDGGSDPAQLAVIRRACDDTQGARLIEAPGANIGRGRNIGIENASGDVILSTDTGCRLDPHWAERMVAPFEDDRRADFVAGFYEIDPKTFLERVIGMTTMRGALDPVCPDTFNPSARSMAFTKALWRRAGGIPEFLDIDDTLFDAKIRKMNVRWVFVGDAVVYWRPRSTFRSLARQFHFYGCGGGHTQIFAESSLYNLRNLILFITAVASTWWQPWCWLIAAALFAYFWIYAYHRKSARVMRAIGDWRAYPLALAVHWTMMLADTSGYLTGSRQRLADPRRYRDGMSAYLRQGIATCDRQPAHTELGSAL